MLGYIISDSFSGSATGVASVRGDQSLWRLRVVRMDLFGWTFSDGPFREADFVEMIRSEGGWNETRTEEGRYEGHGYTWSFSHTLLTSREVVFMENILGTGPQL